MNCKRLIVVLSLVCLTISSSLRTTEAVAQSKSRHAGDKVQLDLAGLVADAVAHGLTAEGFEVHRAGNTLTVATEAGALILDLPATQEALERGEITVSIDGTVATLDRVSSYNLSQGGIADIPSCILAAVDIFGTCTEICDFSRGPGEVLCTIGCTFGLVTNTLRCIED